jgi:hypothetical protein
MKKVMYIVLCVVIISTAMLIAGCSRNNSASKPVTTTKDSGISKSTTPYTAVDDQGKTVYLTETNQEVVKVKELMANYFKATLRDYRTIKGDEDYAYYSKAAIDQLNSENDKANTIKDFKDNQVIQIDKGNTITSIKYTNNYTQCTVVGKSKVENSTIKIKNQMEEYNYTMKVVKENNAWKINEFDFKKV